MIIIGGGLSGLLCGALNPGSVIYEAGPDRPSDHKAVLRCKSNEISRLTGIPFKEVRVHKAIWFGGKEVQPTPRFAHMYSKKVTGTISARSIFNIESGTRFIPPSDFVAQLKKRCEIEYDKEVKSITDITCILFDTPVISTLPMPTLSRIIGDEPIGESFQAKEIIVNQYEIDNCCSYVTVYYPDPFTDIYRATINGSTLIVESTRSISSTGLAIVLDSMGLRSEYGIKHTVQNHNQKFGKITPINQQVREKFIVDMTLEYGIYSLGRFSTWRPKVMMDDLVDDIFHIRRLITGGNYAAINHKQGE
jgi:hypothetical protein